MGRRETRSNRTVLPAKLQPSTQPGGTPQCRSETRDQQAGPRTHQSQITRGRQLAHDALGTKPRARYQLLPRSARQVCRLILHRAGAIIATAKQRAVQAVNTDRKSTRLNSSHANISYAV